MSGYFITATDTDAGKTYVSCLLLDYFAARGDRVGAMKPVASGCNYNSNGTLENSDALLLQQHCSNPQPPMQLLNPYRFEPAIAPHVAAEQQQIAINLATILDSYNQLQQQYDKVIVEGVGGWLVPLNAQQSVATLAQQIQLPVIMVVGVRLGAINHALLTATAIAQSGCHFAGWIANHIDPHMRDSAATIRAIQQRISAPLLAEVTQNQLSLPSLLPL